MANFYGKGIDFHSPFLLFVLLIVFIYLPLFLIRMGLVSNEFKLYVD